MIPVCHFFTVDPTTGRHLPIELPIPQACDAIEDEINFYSAHILRLKTAFNDLAPISTLPSEILCAIFSLATDISDCDSSSRATSFGVVINISHVCRHWRNVALNCPTLWSTLDFNAMTPECIAQFIDKSQKAPLAISWLIQDSYSSYQATSSDGAGKDSSLAVVLRNQLWRVRSLDLSLQLRYNEGDMVLRRLDVPALLLESLKIHCTKFTRLSAKAHKAVLQLVQSTVPKKLHRLELTCVLIPWSQVTLPHLTHLSITGRLHFDAGSHDSQCDLGLLLSAISHMPMLEDLAIVAALDPSSMDPSTEPNHITLPRLRSLRTTEHVFDCIRILDCIIAPSLSYLDLYVQDTISVAHHFASAVAAKAVGLCSFGTVTVDFGSNMSGRRVCAYSDVYDIPAISKLFRAEDKSDEACPPALSVRFGDLGTELHAVVWELCQRLPLASVRTLLVESRGTEISPNFWAALLPKAHNVESLLVSDPGMGGELTFPEVLTPSPSRLESNKEDDRVHEHLNVLPRLAHLALANCNFVPVSTSWTTLKALAEETLLTRLLGCLAARAEEGMGIKNLYLFHTTGLSQEDIDILKNNVDHLDWDEAIHGLETKSSVAAVSGGYWSQGCRDSSETRMLAYLYDWPDSDTTSEEELDDGGQWGADGELDLAEGWVNEDSGGESEDISASGGSDDSDEGSVEDSEPELQVAGQWSE